MSLLRTIMEHSTLSSSGGGNANHSNNTQSSNNGSNNTTGINTNTSQTPTIMTIATPGDPSTHTSNQPSNNAIPNTQNITAELIAIRNSKEQQRRRERRERRIRRQRRGAGGLLPIPTPEQLQHYYHHNVAYGGTFDPYTISAIYGSNGDYGFNCGTGGGLNMPDLLNSHIPSGVAPPPPPYSTLPGSGQRPPASSRIPQSLVHRPTHVSSPSRGARGWRHVIFPSTRSANNRRSQPLFLGGAYEDDAGGGGVGRMDKSCCGVTVTQTVSIRWFIVMIAFVGICCSVVGTVLGAMKASGREHLTVSLLMIGVGIVLITVSGIAWRLTSTDAPSCRAMLGLGGGMDGDDCNGRFLTRPNAMAAAAAAVNYGRPQHPYAAMMYSDFNYRPPPPSYQASMQEYRLRLLLLDRGHPTHNPSSGVNTVTPEQRTTVANNERGHQQLVQASSAIISAIPPPPASGQTTAIGNLSPPPAYRSHLRAAMANAIVHSRPPSYRSYNSDQEIVVPPAQTNTGNNGQTEIEQYSQTSCTTAQINTVDISPLENISTTNAVAGNQNSAEILLKGVQISTLASVETRVPSSPIKSERSIVHPNDTDLHPQSHSNSKREECDTFPITSHESAFRHDAPFPTSSINIQAFSCPLDTQISHISSQRPERCEKANTFNSSVNVIVSSASTPPNINTPNAVAKRPGINIRDEYLKNKVPLPIDEAFAITHSAAELMKTYSPPPPPPSKSDIWQPLPTSLEQPKSLPLAQSANFSPTHLQYLHGSTSGKTSPTRRAYANHTSGGIVDKVVNISTDSSSVLSEASTASSMSSALFPQRAPLKNVNGRGGHNHSSLVTIIHHQKSSSDNEESDCDQSSIKYTRFDSTRESYADKSAYPTEAISGYQSENVQQQNHPNDIVTVTRGTSDYLSRQEPHTSVKGNHQILCVTGLPVNNLTNIDVRGGSTNLTNTMQGENHGQSSVSVSASNSGQQVQFLAHL